MTWSTQRPGTSGPGLGVQVGRALAQSPAQAQAQAQGQGQGPTQDAYDAACAALARHRAAAEEARRDSADKDAVIRTLRVMLDRAQLRIRQLEQDAAAAAQPQRAGQGETTEGIAGPAEPTAHTCNGGRGPFFGRKTAGCPRCDELLAGAEPRAWVGTSRAAQDAQRLADLREHYASERHRNNQCGGLICTYGDW